MIESRQGSLRLTAEQLTSEILRSAYAMFPTGVTAVCAFIDSKPVGLAASSFVSVSIDPPLVSVCIAHSSTTWSLLRRAKRLGISVLGKGHREAARALAAKSADRFSGITWEHNEAGAVFLHDSALWLECSVADEILAGDHNIVVMNVLALESYPQVAPIVFHGSKFTQLEFPDDQEVTGSLLALAQADSCVWG